MDVLNYNQLNTVRDRNPIGKSVDLMDTPAGNKYVVPNTTLLRANYPELSVMYPPQHFTVGDAFTYWIFPYNRINFFYKNGTTFFGITDDTTDTWRWGVSETGGASVVFTATSNPKRPPVATSSNGIEWMMIIGSEVYYASDFHNGLLYTTDLPSEMLVTNMEDLHITYLIDNLVPTWFVYSSQSSTYTTSTDNGATWEPVTTLTGLTCITGGAGDKLFGFIRSAPYYFQNGIWNPYFYNLASAPKMAFVANNYIYYLWAHGQIGYHPIDTLTDILFTIIFTSSNNQNWKSIHVNYNYLMMGNDSNEIAFINLSNGIPSGEWVLTQNNNSFNTSYFVNVGGNKFVSGYPYINSQRTGFESFNVILDNPIITVTGEIGQLVRVK